MKPKARLALQPKVVQRSTALRVVIPDEQPRLIGGARAVQALLEQCVDPYAARTTNHVHRNTNIIPIIGRTMTKRRQKADAAIVEAELVLRVEAQVLPGNVVVQSLGAVGEPQ